MKGQSPTAAQKRWREAVRSLGSVISGGPAVIHHPVGRTGKHNKVDIGHWWLIPLTDEEHKALHNGGEPWKKAYPMCETRKEFEISVFMEIALTLALSDSQEVCPQDAADAIMDYHR